jgi:hypothetical protein
MSAVVPSYHNDTDTQAVSGKFNRASTSYEQYTSALTHTAYIFRVAEQKLITALVGTAEQ